MWKQTVQRTQLLFRLLTRRKLDIIDYLQEEHIRIELLFFRLRFTREKNRKSEIVSLIKKQVVDYIKYEENSFYPACLGFHQMKNLVSESIKEHKHLKSILKDLSPQLSQHRLEAKISALEGELEYHIRREETDLFPCARGFIAASVLAKLGKEMRPEKLSKESNIAA